MDSTFPFDSVTPIISSVQNTIFIVAAVIRIVESYSRIVILDERGYIEFHDTVRLSSFFGCRDSELTKPYGR